MRADLNLIWSLLMKGDYNQDTSDTVRRVTRNVYLTNPKYEPIIDMLVPYSDQLLRGFQIESLIQLVLNSDLLERAQTFDPINTYDNPLLFPTPGNYVSAGLPPDVRIKFTNASTAFKRAGTGRFTANCSVDPSTGSFTSQFGATSFTVTNNLSSSITVRPGFDIRFQGPLGVVPFQVNIEYVVSPRMDLVGLLLVVDGRKYPWDSPELRDIYLTDPLWVNRMAALTMSVVEGSYKWLKNDS